MIEPSEPGYFFFENSLLPLAASLENQLEALHVGRVVKFPFIYLIYMNWTAIIQQIVFFH